MPEIQDIDLDEITARALAYADGHFNHYVDKLCEFIKIPSVSADGFESRHVRESAEFTAALCKSAGFADVRITGIEGAHPSVIARTQSVKPLSYKPLSVLCYAHHDVQPPLDGGLWKSPPFIPDIRDGRLFGRGSADDKAGVLVHAAAVESFLNTSGILPVQINTLIDGEEETGSANIGKLLAKYRDALPADVMIISDMTNYDTGIPSLTVSLRGLCVIEVTVKALEKPLHSGMWGGPIPDPVIALSRIISSFQDDEGNHLIEGLPDNRSYLSEKNQELPCKKGSRYTCEDMSESVFRRQAGVCSGVCLFSARRLNERLWDRPALTVTAIESGKRASPGNVLQPEAWARVTLRTPPGMDSKSACARLEAHIRGKCPWGMTVNTANTSFTDGWCTDTTHPFSQAAIKALASGYGRPVSIIGSGGSIPFVKTMSDFLGGAPALLTGIEDPESNVHGINESLNLKDFQQAIRSEILLFSGLAAAGAERK